MREKIIKIANIITGIICIIIMFVHTTGFVANIVSTFYNNKKFMIQLLINNIGTFVLFGIVLFF